MKHRFELDFFNPPSRPRAKMTRPAVGDTFNVMVAAPGIGYITYRVVEHDGHDVIAVPVVARVRDLTAADVQ